MTSAHVSAADVPVIRLRSASFGYADRAVVSGADLEVHAGEAIALLGPNGCGKSTLVKGLLGLNDHLGGDVDLFGTPIGRFRQRYRLGYVPQRHTVSTAISSTVTEVVAAGRLPRQGILARLGRQDRAAIAEALEVVGLADFARQDVSTLSGGQQRRVLIARALASDPDALVMDEPTAGVDVANQRLLATVLGRLRERGVGLLIVTHEIEALQRVVDRVVYMSAGQITYDGTLTDFETARTAGEGWTLGDQHHHLAPPSPRRAPWAGGRPGVGIDHRVGTTPTDEEDARA